ncbi:hypothetical protein VPGG_00029 [Vibrio phage VBM1]|uniref:hypothetical protein n=1 Tax=Vibrio phage VBM1 TaxID=754074 RepID=UPI0002C14EB7|nr:hypothetical protein VPGG_00029 [Vibrio phage VBM1]AGH07346.1 hypothetical protein VPGG_00029 [Vibrio phage VBM1]
MNQSIINVARYVRDLLDYDENLIQFDRKNTQQSDAVTGYIVVNGSGVGRAMSHGSGYDGDNEVMEYSTAIAKPITLEFYGSSAYENAELFMLLNKSQKAREISRDLGLTIYDVSQDTDVKQLLGYQYGNRIHIDFNIQYCPSVAVDVLRVDATEYDILVDD